MWVSFSFQKNLCRALQLHQNKLYCLNTTCISMLAFHLEVSLEILTQQLFQLEVGAIIFWDFLIKNIKIKQNSLKTITGENTYL